jgi:hypothetical protein
VEIYKVMLGILSLTKSYAIEWKQEQNAVGGSSGILDPPFVGG